MLKKTITFKDYNDNELTEDFYFNLNKADIAKMQLSTEGGFGEYIQAIIKANNGKEIIELFEKILSMAYGVRSEDGRRFKKDPELFKEFMQTEAYSVFFWELVTDANAGAAFVRGIMPADLAVQMDTPAEITAPQDHLPKETPTTNG